MPVACNNILLLTLAFISMIKSGTTSSILNSKVYCLDQTTAVQLNCPFHHAEVNVFEIRFSWNGSCSTTDDDANYTPQLGCPPRSIRGRGLLNCRGTNCSLSTMSPVGVCSRKANRFYVLYECIPVVLDRSVTWFRPPHHQIDAESAKVNLMCPPEMTIVIRKAQAISGPLTKPRCSSSESFTTQIVRSCCDACSTCNVSVVALRFRCKGMSMKNDKAIVDYSCVPRPEHFRDIKKHSICDNLTIETDGFSNGYIVSPDYPAQYGKNLKCSLNISPIVRHQDSAIDEPLTLKLYVLAFDVQYPHTLTISTTNRSSASGLDSSGINHPMINSYKLQQKDVHPKLYSFDALQPMALKFTTNFNKGGKGFRIYFSLVETSKQPEPYFTDEPTTTSSTLSSSAHYTVVFDETNAIGGGRSIDVSGSDALLASNLYDNSVRRSIPKPAILYAMTTVAMLLLLMSFGLLFMLFHIHRRKKSVYNKYSNSTRSTFTSFDHLNHFQHNNNNNHHHQHHHQDQLMNHHQDQQHHIGHIQQTTPHQPLLLDYINQYEELIRPDNDNTTATMMMVPWSSSSNEPNCSSSSSPRKPDLCCLYCTHCKRPSLHIRTSTVSRVNERRNSGSTSRMPHSPMVLACTSDPIGTVQHGHHRSTSTPSSSSSLDDRLPTSGFRNRLRQCFH